MGVVFGVLPKNRKEGLGETPTRTRGRFDRLKALSLSKGTRVLPSKRDSRNGFYVFSKVMV